MKKKILISIIALIVVIANIIIYNSITFSTEDVLDEKIVEHYYKWLRYEINNDRYNKYNKKNNPYLKSITEDRNLPVKKLFLTLYDDGFVLARAFGTGQNLFTTFKSACDKLKTQMKEYEVEYYEFSRCRIKLDLIKDEADIWSFHPELRTLSFLEGVDAVKLEYDDKEEYILPDDYIKLGSGGMIINNFQIWGTGIDLQKLLQAYIKEKKMLNPPSFDEVSFSRCQTESYIESYMHDKAFKVYRCNILLDEIDKELVYSSIRNAGEYFKMNVDEKENGRINYIYNPLEDKIDNSHYSFPRHAGSTYGMYKIYETTKDRETFYKAEKALNFLMSFRRDFSINIMDKSKKYGMYIDNNTDIIHLGNISLTLLALLQRAKITGDKRYKRVIDGLGDFLLFMQKDDGSFAPFYWKSTNVRGDDHIVLNYGGQAILAMTRLYNLTKKEKWKKSLKKALDNLIEEQWEFFLSDYYEYYFFWEIQAICESYKVFQNEEYVEYASRMVEDFIKYVAHEGELPIKDFDNMLYQSLFMTPNSSDSGIFLEGFTSYYKFLRENNRQHSHLDWLAKGFTKSIINLQIDRENGYLYKNIDKAIGGIRYNAVSPYCRNDYTQHCITGVIYAYQSGIFD